MTPQPNTLPEVSTSQFLLIVQGAQVIATAERTLRRTERALGVSLECHTIPEHEIAVYVSRRGEGHGARAENVYRCLVPLARGGQWSNRQLVFALRRRGGALSNVPGSDLTDADSALIARVQHEEPGGAYASLASDVFPSADSGDFCIAFDPANDVWTLARGSPGLQTLYYKVNRDRATQFAASTQLRALLPLFDSRPALDQVAVSRFLCNGFFCEPETPIAGIRSLLPHEVIRSARADDVWQPQCDMSSVRDASAVTEQASVESSHSRVRQKLIQVIDVHTARSTDVACLLSGGVDSSAVAAVAATLLGKTVHTYTLVFEDAAINEAQYASAVASRIGSKHHEVLLKQGDFEGSLEWLLGSLDLPTTDGLNSLLITRAIGKAGHPTALVGVGSDELFGGHECMQRVPRALALMRAVNSLPAIASKLARAAAATMMGCARDPWRPSHGLRGKLLALMDGDADPLSVYLLSRRVLLPAAVARLRPGTSVDHYERLPDRVMNRIPRSLPAQPILRQVSHFEQLVYLRNQLLRDLQMVGVATGVDIHAPFVDSGLVSLVSSLPPNEVFSGARPKQFLIDCVSDVLPREAYERPKLGFVLPIGQWLGGAVTSRIEQLTTQRELLEYLDLDISAVGEILDDCAAARGRVFYTREWSLFVLLDWCSRHLLQDPTK